MNNNIRVVGELGKEQNLKVELKQDFDLLEVLSIKFSQREIYASLSSDYGVVVGRVSVNNGFGIPNARVSIFIPLDELDEEDPVISSLYPYKTVTDKNEDGFRYNLLPKRKQHGGHTPTGTFPDQTDVLNREEVMEVYEKYYKYTVRTNDAGDFMIWGVPLGEQTLHVDIDFSDIGCFSLRPYDFIQNGVGVGNFKNSYEYKSSEDLDSLPQVRTFNKTINVYPFWGNEEIHEIGITRTDFDLSETGFKIEPKAFLIGGTYTDTNKNSVNKNCTPRAKMGRKCDLQTKSGIIEAIRFTHHKDSQNRPVLEEVDGHFDIPDDGGFVYPVPMNMDFIYTNEYGEREITNDPTKGVATSACYRFRFSTDDAGNKRLRKTASYLVPNIREYDNDQNRSYAFSTNWGDYPTAAVSGNIDRGILYNEFGEYFPRDYFYRMTYNKVYTVSSFHNMYFDRRDFRDDRYVGIKEIAPGEENDCGDFLNPPINYATKNRTFMLTVTEIFLFFEYIFNVFTLTLGNTLIRVLYNVGRAIDTKPVRFVAVELKNLAHSLQNETQTQLALVSYPDCEVCGEMVYTDSALNATTVSYAHCTLATWETTINGKVTAAATPNYINKTDVSDIECKDNAEYFNGSTVNNNSKLIQEQEEYSLMVEFDEGNDRRVMLDRNSVDDGYAYLEIDPSDGTRIIVKNLELYNNSPYVKISLRKNTIKELPRVDHGISTGCDLYDTPYDESYISVYYLSNGQIHINSPGTSLPAGANVTSSDTCNYDWRIKHRDDGSKKNDTLYFYRDRNDGQNCYQLLPVFNHNPAQLTTRSGFSEFQNGIYKLVLGSQSGRTLRKVLKEYFIRKKVAKLFCGGVANYSFVDNWLSGSLYFFQFKGKKNKYCGDVVYRNSDQKRFYYRSCVYNLAGNRWGARNGLLGRPTTMVDLGPRDEFIKEICIDPGLDPNCSVTRSVGSSSYQSFGELLGLAINYRLDINNANYDIKNFFENDGFAAHTPNQKILNGDILQLISINNEVGIEEFDLTNPNYLGYSYQFLDPDNPNTRGIFLHKDSTNSPSKYGPLPVTFTIDADGERVRSCINEPTHIANDGQTYIQGRLTESSQKVPFYLWNKRGRWFGSGTSQSWDYNTVQVQPLQGMTYGYKLRGVQDDSSDKYLLLPMTKDFGGLLIKTDNITNDVGFDIVDFGGTDTHTLYDNEYPGFTYLHVTESAAGVPLTGNLYVRVGSAGTWVEVRDKNNNGWSNEHDVFIRPTSDYYDDNGLQILSTPFLFYFGLKAGKTGVDKFIQFFGDQGAFTTEE